MTVLTIACNPRPKSAVAGECVRGVGLAAAGGGIGGLTEAGRGGGGAEDRRAAAEAGERVGGEHGGGRGPARPLGGEVVLVGVLPAGPVGAVFVPQPADRREYLVGAFPLAAGVEGEHELAGLRDRDPRLVAHAADAEAGHHE